MDKNTLLFIKEHEKCNVKELALQAKRYPEIDMPFVIQQIAGRQIASSKIPTWYNNDAVIYPKHISLEQCSSEETAKYKASLCKGSTFTDLTGGLGVDFSFMSRNFESATFIEKQEELCVLANQNFVTLGISNAEIINTDSVEYLSRMNKVDVIYIDPARRSDIGRKTVLIEDCTPDLTEIEDLIDNKCEKAIIKLSPMLDISLTVKSLKNISKIHIISYNNECKELLLIKEQKEGDFFYRCINISNDGSISQYTFNKETETSLSCCYAKNLMHFLYEPNTSIMKAGAYKSICRDFDVEKIHINSHLYTSDKDIKEFPGRRFLIKDIRSFNKKEIKSLSLEIPKANITVRNFPLSVEEIRKRTAIKDGGNIYIFATTLSDEKKVLIICEKI